MKRIEPMEDKDWHWMNGTHETNEADYMNGTHEMEFMKPMNKWMELMKPMNKWMERMKPIDIEFCQVTAAPQCCCRSRRSLRQMQWATPLT